MQLNDEQIKRFNGFHQQSGLFDLYTTARIQEIVQGTANYYLTLFSIQQRIKRENDARNKREN